MYDAFQNARYLKLKQQEQETTPVQTLIPVRSTTLADMPNVFDQPTWLIDGMLTRQDAWIHDGRPERREDDVALPVVFRHGPRAAPAHR